MLRILSVIGALCGVLLSASDAQLIGLPPAPRLTPAGRALIFDGETGGERVYNRSPHPEYPGGASGVTWGIGYDAHQNSADTIRDDWRQLGAPIAQRLSLSQPYFGQAARAYLPKVRDITVPWAIATDVFLRIDLSRVDAQCRRAFPSFARYRPTAQDAVRSLVFNRGPSMAGPARVEMRALRDCLERGDYEGAAQQEIAMIRLWVGRDIYNGMRNRRMAEAQLFRTP
ncbi:MAG: hypothetical protein V4710_19005 [Verrucomicrobiota bacterium]